MPESISASQAQGQPEEPEYTRPPELGCCKRSGLRGVCRHRVKFLEILLGHGRELRVRGVIAGDAVDDNCGGASLVGCAPVAEFVARQAWARQQHFACAHQRFDHLGVKGSRVTGLALVFVVAASLDALGLNVLMVKHDHMGFLMVQPDHSVKSAHENPWLKINGDARPKSGNRCSV